MPYIGIDFGTTNSVVAAFEYGQADVIPNREGQKYTPSVVTLRPDGTLSVGREAKENFDEKRSVRSVKRLLGSSERVTLMERQLRPEQIVVMLLSMLKQDAEKHVGEPIRKAVITIPANSKGLARNATKMCATAAGLQVLTLLNEPTAAAICYGLTGHEKETILVYDFGGGTLDVTILRSHHGVFEEISSKGIGRLGGDDLDLALGRVVAKRFEEKTGYDILHSPHRQSFLLAMERAKIQLSKAERVVIRRPELVPEKHLSLEEEVTRETLERAIMPLLERSGTAIDEALSRRGMWPEEIDRVLLVGGSSKIPLVREYVCRRLGGKHPEPIERVDPLTCVAQGAAIVSAILQGAPGLDEYAYSVKLEHSLCANPVDEEDRVYLDPIIKRGCDIPCSFTKTYYPVADPAKRVVISVVEGDVYDDPNDPENVKLANIPWEFNPPRPAEQAALEVTYEYGDDGILTVQIHDLHGRHKKRFAIEQAGQDQLGQEQMTRIAQSNQAVLDKTVQFETVPAYQEAIRLLRKVERELLPRLDFPKARAKLERLCQAVRVAIGTSDIKQLKAANAELNERLLDYTHMLAP
jgi:molecular chaperone DnaK